MRIKGRTSFWIFSVILLMAVIFIGCIAEDLVHPVRMTAYVDRIDSDPFFGFSEYRLTVNLRGSAATVDIYEGEEFLESLRARSVIHHWPLVTDIESRSITLIARNHHGKSLREISVPLDPGSNGLPVKTESEYRDTDNTGLYYKAANVWHFYSFRHMGAQTAAYRRDIRNTVQVLPSDQNLVLVTVGGVPRACTLEGFRADPGNAQALDLFAQDHFAFPQRVVNLGERFWFNPHTRSRIEPTRMIRASASGDGQTLIVAVSYSAPLADQIQHVDPRQFHLGTGGQPLQPDQLALGVASNRLILRFEQSTLELEDLQSLSYTQSTHTEHRLKDHSGVLEVQSPDTISITDAQEYELTLEANPNEGGTLNGAGSYEPGDWIALTAQPNAGFRFVRWTQDGSLISSQADFPFTMPAQHTTLLAHFEEEAAQCTITAQSDPELGGEVRIDDGAWGINQSVTVNRATQVTLVARENTGYTWDGWYDGATRVSADKRFSFQATASKTYRAKFNPESPGPQPIQVGPQALLEEQVIASGDGGVVQINQPGHPLHGLELSVPPNSYDGLRTFRISSADILDHAFGDRFNPLTPMIIVENGGGYSDEMMLVEIPVVVPEDHFAMAFLYDPVTGQLEGMQLISAEDGKILIGTRRFSMFTVTGISQALLDSYIEQGIHSGFQPGVDDFSFANRGSFISPYGHCAGQAIGAMWYYAEKKAESGSLWGMYDNNFGDLSTPDFWLDDSWAYRFCAVIQIKLDFTNFASTFFANIQGYVLKQIDGRWQLVEVPGIGDTGTRNLFALSMLLTGEPQYIGVRNMQVGGGHAMVAYSVTQDAIGIADPNYPGMRNRKVYYSDGQFQPYSSGANAEDIAAGQGKLYDWIRFVSNRTMIDYGLVAPLWEQVLDGTIGNDLFPDNYAVRFRDPSTNEILPLVDGHIHNEPKLITWLSGERTIHVYRNQTRLEGSTTQMEIDLVPGANLLGFAVWGRPPALPLRYIDFHYFNVYYGSIHNATQDTWHLSFADAHDQADAGDEIVVYPGTYDSFEIDKSLTVRSAHGPENTIIDGGVISIQTPPFEPDAPELEIHISGLTIQNSPVFGIQCYVNHPVALHIHENRIINNRRAGILIHQNDILTDRVVHGNISIIGNTIQGNQLEGSRIRTTADVTIKENVMTGNGFAEGYTGSQLSGIHVSRARKVWIEDNTIEDHQGHGIYFSDLRSDLDILGNRIQDNHRGGVWLYGTGSQSDPGINVTISDNTISRNRLFGGLSLGWSQYESVGQLTITNNTIEENVPHGISVGGDPFDTQIINNTVKENRTGDGGATGGGIRFSSSAGTHAINENVISYNSSHWVGGISIQCPNSTVTVQGNTIHHNAALNGAGISFAYCTDSTITVQGNTIHHNAAREKGGGIMVYDNCDTITLTGNSVHHNTAGDENDNSPGYGGGVYVHTGSDVFITGNSIYDNHAKTRGGGVYGCASNWERDAVVTVNGESRTVRRHSPPFEESSNTYDGNTHGDPFEAWGPGEDNVCIEAGYDVTLP